MGKNLRGAGLDLAILTKLKVMIKHEDESIYAKDLYDAVIKEYYVESEKTPSFETFKRHIREMGFHQIRWETAVIGGVNQGTRVWLPPKTAS
jgi:hypothetical protein